MMLTNPKISINIITYNREKFLSQAIDSVLFQSFNDWELLIVDDCSTDNTFELVSNYIKKDARIKYYANKTNLGVSKSRNVALRLSLGKFIAVLDSDDYWVNTNKLQKQFDLLNDGSFVLVGGGCQVVSEMNEKKYRISSPISDKLIRRNFLIKNPFVNSSVVFDKDIAVEVGGYDETLRIGEDYDLFLKLGIKGAVANIGEILVNYRQHDQNISKIKLVNALEDNLIIIKRYSKFYPNYFLALIRRLIRLYIAKILFFKKT